MFYGRISLTFVLLRLLVIIRKGFLKLSNSESVTSQKLGSWDFWLIDNSVLNKGKSAIPPLFNDPKVLSSASDKAKLFATNYSRNSYLYDSGISCFPSRTNLTLNNIPVTPKLVKKVCAFVRDCILVEVLKNCELELIICVWRNIAFNLKSSSVVPVFKNVGRKMYIKKTHSC